jgi:cytidylate kinase
MINKIITIDGFASTGKSTISKKLANHLGYLHIDTGQMYRAITLKAINEKAIIDERINENLIKKIIGNSIFSISKKNDSIILNNNEYGDELRSISVSDKVSKVSSLKLVRQFMVIEQRKLAENKNVVVEGRDIGTIVFPFANIKFFMNADPNVRARRRFDQLKKIDSEILFDQVLKNVLKRDFVDSNREIAPLKKPEDSVEIDTSSLNINEVFNLMLSYI